MSDLPKLVIPEDDAILKQEEGNNYIFLGDEGSSVWITVGNISVYIKKDDEGVSVDLFPLHREMEASLAGTWALYQDAYEMRECPVCHVEILMDPDEQASFESHGKCRTCHWDWQMLDKVTNPDVSLKLKDGIVVGYTAWTIADDDPLLQNIIGKHYDDVELPGLMVETNVEDE